MLTNAIRLVRNAWGPRAALALLLVLPLLGAGPAIAQDDVADEVKREEQRVARRKKLKSGFSATELLVAGMFERFALQPIREWDDAMGEVLQEKPIDLVEPLRYYLIDEDWEVVAFSCLVVGLADLRVLLPELGEAYDVAAYAIIRRKAMEAAAIFGKRKVAEVRELLRKGAKDDEPGVRLHAADGLEGLGDAEAIQDLRSLVEDADPDVRYRARTGLARLGDGEAQKKLIEEFRSYVGTRDKQRRASLVKNDVGERYAQFLNALALGGWGDIKGIKLLGRALLRKDEYKNKLFLSIGAATALGRSRPKEEEARKEQRNLLRAALLERDATIRAMAALAVGYTRDPLYLKPLTGLLGDAQLDVRHNAVEALGRIPGNDSVSLLGAVLRRERDVAIRLAALRALTHHDGPAVVKGLTRALSDKRYMVRASAARLLGRIGPEAADAAKALIKSARDRDYGVRESAVVSLARIGAPEGLAVIAGALDDPDQGVRTRALRSLARFPDRAAVKESEEAGTRAVALLVGSKSARERKAARGMLLEVRSPMAVPSLIKALDHDEQESRGAALWILRTYNHGRSLGYGAKLTGNERSEAIRNWEAWWEAGGPISAPEPPPKVRSNIDLPKFHKYARDLRWRGIDLVLAYDSTGSMIPVIRAVKQRLDLLIEEATRIVPNLQMSLFTYRDEGEEYLYYGTPLTFAADNLKSFVQVAEANRGGDLPEAITFTLKAIIKNLLWREEAQKVIVVIGDAPYHPENRKILFDAAKQFARPDNRGIIHAIYTDPNRLGESVSARKSREEGKAQFPFLERFKELAKVGRGRAITIEDTEMLITEILVLSFGEQWREELESRLDFD